MGLLTTSSKNGSLDLDFKTTAQQVAELFQSEEILVTPFHDETLPHFRALPSNRKAQAVREIHTYLACLQIALSKGGSLKDDRQSLWAALKMFNMRPTSDLFEILRANYSVELYNAEGIQLWRNFKFLEVCGYTLEEVFSYTWQERYVRDEQATANIMNVLAKMQSKYPPQTMRPQIKNLIVETFSSHKYTIDVLHDYMSPVLDAQKNFAGFIVLSDVKIVNEARTNENSRTRSLSLIKSDHQIQ